ncbi:MAG: hypothetical protein DMG57_17835 [Acidobacteria bacterium]|nr:MAG: hypothetical protein DMG57_17835 [Acidobacteriota bacterium]
MNWKLLFWLTALTLLLSVASLWFEPSNDFALPSDFTHPRIAAAFVRNAAEIRSIYGWGEDWRGEFASQLRADKLILSSLLFSCLANCASIRALMFIAALAGFAQNYGLWEATVNPGYPAPMMLYPALVRFGLLGLTWIVLGHKFLLSDPQRNPWRKMRILGLAVIGMAAVLNFKGGPVWHWSAFLLPVTYVAVSLWGVLRLRHINQASDALEAGAGLGSLNAGVIVAFAVLFANSRVEMAFTPLLVAISFQLALLNIQQAHELPKAEVPQSRSKDTES